MADKSNEKPHLKKEAMIEALESALGVVTTACKKVGIDRTTHYRWLREDPDYKISVDSISDISIDFAESQLFKQIKDGNTTATIFYLKTKGKNRGYVEKVDFTGDVNLNTIKRVVVDASGD
jgi:hypothetical protein